MVVTPEVNGKWQKSLELFFSKDEVIRQCKVETENCIMSRPVNQFYSLEINIEDEIEQ